MIPVTHFAEPHWKERFPHGYQRRPPPHGGQASHLLLLLHGSGCDAAHMLQIVDDLTVGLPNPVVYALNGKLLSRNRPGKYQHFEVESLHTAEQWGKPPEQWSVIHKKGKRRNEAEQMAQIAANLDAAIEDYNAVLDKFAAAEGVPSSRIMIAGYSQGAMMALHMAPRRAEPIAAVASLFSALVAGDRLRDETVSRMPIFMASGANDTVLPIEALALGEAALSQAGFPVNVAIFPGADHHNDWVQSAPHAGLFFADHADETPPPTLRNCLPVSCHRIPGETPSA